MHETCYTFGRQQFLAGRRVLVGAGGKQQLNPHLSLLLLALLERSGSVVPHAELARILWPEAAVPGVRLNAQVEDLIAAVFGGDRSGATIHADETGAWISGPITRTLVAFDDEAEGEGIPSNLPALRTRLIGRSALVAGVLAQMQSSRLVTLVGPGGVGKTSVAISASASWEKLTGRGAVFIDLARISDPALLWTTMLAALAGAPQGHPRETVIAQFQANPTLIVFDNCEHVAEEVAAAAAELLDRCRGTRILATSREALRLPAEQVAPVLPLAVPGEEDVVDTATFAANPAVELFFERLGEAGAGYRPGPDDYAAAGQLCRRLDGMPLAIEFAAARVGTGGVGAVLDQLERRFDLLKDERRGNGDRHAGLTTVLDWSYGLLTFAEQKCLRIVSVFPAEFSPQDVIAVSAHEGPVGIVHAALRSLLAKSMLVARREADGGETYRLLESTRDYALSKLAETGEKARYFDAFAAHVLARLQTADHRDAESTLALWNLQRSNVAAALEWTLRGGGAKCVGVDIVAAAVPTWLLLSEISRYSDVLAQALDAVAEVMPERRDLAQQFAFSRSVSLYFAMGPNAPGIAAGEHALALADALGDQRRMLDSAWNLHAQSSHLGTYAESLHYGRRFLRIARAVGNADAVYQGWRLIAWGYDGLGYHRRAERVFATFVEQAAWVNIKPETAWAPDARVIRACMRARFDWFAGRPAAAQAAIEEAIGQGQAEERGHTFCTLLAHIVVPTAVWNGDLELASRYVAILRDRARRNFDNFTKWADLLSDGIEVCGGGKVTPSLRARIEASWPFRQEVFATLHPALAVDAMLDLRRAPAESWSRPELLRLIGNRALAAGDVAAARALFAEGLALAKARGSVPFADALEAAIAALA